MKALCSDSSNWPSHARRSPPHAPQILSASSETCTCSTMASFGCALGPWPRCGSFESASSVFARGLFSLESPKIFWRSVASWFSRPSSCSASCSGSPPLSSCSSRRSFATSRASFWFSASRSNAALRTVSMSFTSPSVMQRETNDGEQKFSPDELFLRARLGKLRPQVDLRQKRRAQRHPPDRLAALDEQRELTQRHLDRALFRAFPWRREQPLLESLREQAHPRAIEVEHLGPLSVPAHEQVQVARQHVAPQRLGHDRRQRVEVLSHVARVRVREHPHPPSDPDHPTSLKSSPAPSPLT